MKDKTKKLKEHNQNKKREETKHDKARVVYYVEVVDDDEGLNEILGPSRYLKSLN